MYNYGKLVTNGEDYHDTYYIDVYDETVVIDKSYHSSAHGKITIYHSGTYFGSEEEFDSYLQGKIFDHLVNEGYLVQDGENMMDMPMWELVAPANKERG